MKPDCIYFEETYQELPKFHHCTRTCNLYEKGLEDAAMCQQCRLWDAYIPKSASDEEKERAIKWQNMSYDEQPDYHDYFGPNPCLSSPYVSKKSGKMKARVYYFIGDYDDSIVIEGADIDELREKCDYEIKRRGATYSGSEMLEED